MRYLPLVLVSGAISVAGCAGGPSTGTGSCEDAPTEAATLAAGDRRATDLAVAAGGQAVAAWETTVGGALEAAVRTADGTWSPAAAVSGPDSQAPTTAITPGGRATVAWDGYTRGGRVVQVAERLPGGAWGPARVMGTPGGVRPRFPSLGAGGEGTLVLAWARDPGGALMAAVRAPGADWSAPAVVLARGDVREVRAVVDTTGRPSVAWIEGREAGRTARAATLDGGRWSAPADLSAAGATAVDVQIAAGADGWLAVAWRTESGRNDQRLELRTRPAGAAWGPARPVGARGPRPLGIPRPPGPISLAPSVVVAGDGTATVAWPLRRDDRDRVATAVVAPDGSVRGPWLPSTSWQSNGARLALAPDGTTVMVWEDLDGDRLALRSAALARGASAWTGCRVLTPEGTEPAAPAVGWAPGGPPVAVWTVSNFGDIRAAGLGRP